MSNHMTYGGFLGLEPSYASFSPPPFQGIPMSLGRHGFALILNALRPRKIFLPFYLCDSMLDVTQLYHTEIEFYGLSEELEPNRPLAGISGTDALLYVNYFGVKGATCENLSQRHGNKLILDQSQALRVTSQKRSWTFNSLRKFVGLPDGAFVEGPEKFPDLHFDRARPAHEFLVQRQAGKSQEAFRAFQRQEAAFSSHPQSISSFSQGRIGQIDWQGLILTRRQNFLELQNILGNQNELNLALDENDIPLYFPLLTANKNIRARCANVGLYIPQLWQDVLKRADSRFHWEVYLSRNLLPLPIDQRYNLDDMREIAKRIQRLIRYD